MSEKGRGLQERPAGEKIVPTSSESRHLQILRWAWFGCMTVVIIGSLLPPRSLPMRALARLEVNDKIQHFASYALLAFLPAVHERPRLVRGIALALIGLGVLLEYGQLLVSRDFETLDMVADATGVFLGIAVGWPLRSWVERAFPIRLAVK
jgi:VanZ family protein